MTYDRLITSGKGERGRQKETGGSNPLFGMMRPQLAWVTKGNVCNIHLLASVRGECVGVSVFPYVLY